MCVSRANERERDFAIPHVCKVAGATAATTAHSVSVSTAAIAKNSNFKAICLHKQIQAKCCTTRPFVDDASRRAARWPGEHPGAEPLLAGQGSVCAVV